MLQPEKSWRPSGKTKRIEDTWQNYDSISSITLKSPGKLSTAQTSTMLKLSILFSFLFFRCSGATGTTAAQRHKSWFFIFSSSSSSLFFLTFLFLFCFFGSFFYLQSYSPLLFFVFLFFVFVFALANFLLSVQHFSQFSEQLSCKGRLYIEVWKQDKRDIVVIKTAPRTHMCTYTIVKVIKSNGFSALFPPLRAQFKKKKKKKRKKDARHRGREHNYTIDCILTFYITD